MVYEASGTRQYFLGVAGNQTGPFTDAQVMEKIRASEIPGDALVWYEGLPEWQAISTVEFFQEAFSSAPPPPPDATNIPVNTGAPRFTAPTPGASASTAPRKKAKAEPPGANAFGGGLQTPGFVDGAFWAMDAGKLKLLIGAGVAVVLGMGTVFFVMSQNNGIVEETTKILPKTHATIAPNRRQETLREAGSEMVAHPDVWMEQLKKLVRERSDDSTGKDALNQILQFYHQNQRPFDAGSFLMEVKRPQEAYKFFLSDSSAAAQGQAEVALYRAFQESTDPTLRREYLLNDIQLLIQPLDKMDVALERIRLFAKTFPNSPHPYGYYLKTNDEKIAELFNKISNFFVVSLLDFAGSEFPELHLDGRPIVEVRREHPDQFRITGRYKGRVKLRQDQLEDIHFVFWMVDGNWVVAETNLTTERQRWAQGNKTRYGGKLMSGEQMLAYEQNLFKSQFPESAFHESGVALKRSNIKKRTHEE